MLICTRVSFNREIDGQFKVRTKSAIFFDDDIQYDYMVSILAASSCNGISESRQAIQGRTALQARKGLSHIASTDQ